MIEQLKAILKQLEASLRGKKFNESFLSDSQALFKWAHACFLENRSIDEQERVQLIECAVKMHNRAKTITSPRHLESITNLKATAAWILSAYAEKNSKFCILFIRLHCRIASEWTQLKDVSNAIYSYEEALRSWKTLNISALDRMLPRVELDTLRKTVFYGYLDLSKLLREGNDNCDWSAIRQCIGGALEILPQPQELRLTMAQHVLELAHHLATLLLLDEGIHYFHVILSILDSSVQSVSNDGGMSHEKDKMPEKTWQREVLLVKMKAFLGLGYLHKELAQCEKASSFIDKAKEINDEISALTVFSSSPVTLAAETFTFASFSIHCRSNNVAAAETSMNLLLKQTNSFDLALSSVRIFLEGCGSDVDGDLTVTDDNGGSRSSISQRLRKYRHLFDTLEEKFPSDPEYTSIRLVHLKFAYSFSTLGISLGKSERENENEDSRHASELGLTVISDHAERRHIMTAPQSQQFLHILQERVHWLQSQEQFEDVIKTCDMLLSLTGVMYNFGSVFSACNSCQVDSISTSGADAQAECGPSVESMSSSARTESSSVPNSTANTSASSTATVTSTSLVVMQWKSHACLQLMKRYLELNQSALLTQEGSKNRELIRELAEKGIGLALEAAMDHHSTRTLLLAFHAVMTAGQYCSASSLWKKKLIDAPSCPMADSTPSSSGLLQGVELVLLLLQKEKRSIFVEERSSLICEDSRSGVDFDEVRSVSEEKRCIEEVEKHRTTKMMLKQLLMCCQLSKEADECKDHKGVAILRLQQAWLSLYDHHFLRNNDDSGNCATESLCSKESDKFASQTPPTCGPCGVPFLSVLCEMAELFLKTYLRCTTRNYHSVDICSGIKPDTNGEGDKEAALFAGMKRKRESWLGLDTDAMMEAETDADVDANVSGLSCDESRGMAREMDCQDIENTTPAGGKSLSETSAMKSAFSCVPVLLPRGEDKYGEGGEHRGCAIVDDEVEMGDDCGLLYHFRCSASSLQRHLFPYAKHLLALTAHISPSLSLEPSTFCSSTVSQIDLGALGVQEEVLWVANMLWNVGVLLMKNHLCILADPSSFSGPPATQVRNLLRDPGQLPLPLSPSLTSILLGGDDSSKDLTRYEAGAEALELCQQVYSVAAQWPTTEESTEIEREKKDKMLSYQCSAALNAAAIRIDINCLLELEHDSAPSTGIPSPVLSGEAPDDSSATLDLPASSGGSAEKATSSNEAKTNVAILMRNFLTVETLLHTLFEHGLAKDHPFNKLYVMLSLSARLILGSNDWDFHDDKSDTEGGHCSRRMSSAAEEFLASHSSSLMALTPLDLIKCADLALRPEARGRSEKVARDVLRLAVQLQVRESQPSYALLGNLYRRLVELSPDKDDALHLLEEFEQLIFSVSPPRQPSAASASGEGQSATQYRSWKGEEEETEKCDQGSDRSGEKKEEDSCPFLASDVDCIVTKAFNFSILLIELDQTGVAERFVSKAMNLLCFTSPTFAPWKDMVRDLYFYVLKKKADFDAGRRVLFLQEQHKSTTAAAAFHASSDSAAVSEAAIASNLVCTTSEVDAASPVQAETPVKTTCTSLSLCDNDGGAEITAATPVTLPLLLLAAPLSPPPPPADVTLLVPTLHNEERGE